MRCAAAVLFLLLQLEFLCYRLIYTALQGMRLDTLRLLSELGDTERGDRNVAFCIRLREALFCGNFRRYFSLSKKAPFFARHLCDIFQPRVRMMALLTLAKASLTLQVSKVEQLLHFASSDEALEFLREQKAVFSSLSFPLSPSFSSSSAATVVIDCRKSVPVFEASTLLSKKVKAMG